MWATHNRAGEIVIEQIGGCASFMVRCTIITYTKTSSVAADRDTLTLCWGDGKCDRVARINGFQPDPGVAPQGEPLPNDIKRNFYVAIHTYPGPGRYTVSMTDPNRNGGILNVNPPGSENVQFHIQTTFTLYNGNFDGCNNTPRLLNPPIDYACVGETFVHNPGAYDPDGDSLSYELIVPMQDVGTPVPNYIWPPDVPGNGGCCLTLDEVKGTLKWDAPQVPGEYNVAMIIISWRNGVPIDTTIRDMQILVFNCEKNHAPEIETIEELCVVAGELVEFTVTATDPDAGDKIKLSALGAPFELPFSPASDVEIWRPFGNPSAVHEAQPVTKTFRWQTSCEHISDLPYTIVFKAEDDFFLSNVSGSTGLATLKTVRIKVVGPPPQDLRAEPVSDPAQIVLKWQKPYACEETENDLFFGFSVWRREGSNNFPPDTCAPGLDGKGYTKIATVGTSVGPDWSYTDTDVERGRTYCYRVLAIFARRTETGKPYNLVESLPSEEVCLQLNRDVPLITKVSVEKTDAVDGRIRIQWTKPLAEDLDTLLNPPPYRYQLRRSTGIGTKPATIVAEFTSPTYWQLDQQEYLDVGLNTLDEAYTYDIAFYVNGENSPLGFAPAASSVRLQISPTDNANNLLWTFSVPWVNERYTVFRFNGTSWDTLATGITDNFYVDTGLINGRQYCYYVLSEGTYGVPDLPALYNNSQEACAIPVDNVAPCPPKLSVFNLCNQNINCSDAPLENRLLWVNPMNICPTTDDVTGYRIYYAPIQGEQLQLIAEIDFSGDTTFLHQPERGIAGCYAVTAIDTFFNESASSNIVCVDNCPNYQLPNAFTPNGDGANDLFRPYPYCFIESIDLLVYNRWGELVFETRDPDINWDGTNLRGQQLPAGTYHYVCKVVEQRVSGNVESPTILRGYIDIIRN